MPRLGEQDVVALMDTLSNWGRWGADDELGTINHITPDVRRRAAALVRDGVSVTCARPIVTNDIAADTTIQPLRFMVDSGEGRDTDDNERILQRRGAAEFIGMVFHGYSITHVDAPSHYFWQGRMYNGRSCNLVTAREGARAGSVDLLRDGVVSRGVLLDVARAKGLDRLPGDHAVTPEDLEEAEEFAGTKSRAGDIVLVRTGQVQVYLAGDKHGYGYPSPGLSIRTPEWFHARDVAAEQVGAGRGTTRQLLIGPEEGPNFALRRFTMGEGGGMPLHTNRVEHEQYVLRGRATIGIGDEEVEVAKDDVLFIPAGVPLPPRRIVVVRLVAERRHDSAEVVLILTSHVLFDDSKPRGGC